MSEDPFNGEKITASPPERERIPPLICAGVFLSPRGLKGHVKIKSFLEEPAYFKTYSPFCDEEGNKKYNIIKVLDEPKGEASVVLEGVNDRTAAETLKGSKLMLSRTQLPDLANDVFYHADLIGLQVLSVGEHSLGTVQGVYNFGAGDILDIRLLTEKDVMLLFSHETVPEVNVSKGFIRLSHEGEHLLRGGKIAS